MAVISTGSVPDSLWPGIYAWWGQKYNEHSPQYPDLYEKHSSAKAFEEDVQVTGMGLAPVKPETTGVTYEAMAQGFKSRYTHVTYASGYIVTREQEEDGQYEAVSRGFATRLAFSMNQTKENVAANVYNRAFNPLYLGGDGVSLLNASHPSRAGLWSNLLNPAADLSEASLEDLMIDIANTEDDLGLKIGIMGQTLHIPTALMFEAERILKSTLQNWTANNALNALKSQGVLPGGIKINNYFSDSDAFFVRTNAPSGMKCYQRREIEFTQDNDFDTENHKHKSTERYSFYWTDPRGLRGSAGV